MGLQFNSMAAMAHGTGKPNKFRGFSEPFRRLASGVRRRDFLGFATFYFETWSGRMGTPGRGFSVTIELEAPGVASPTTAGLAVEIGVAGGDQAPRLVRRMVPLTAWASSGDRRCRRQAGTRCNGRRNDCRRNVGPCGKPRAMLEKSRPARG